ncbi:hypothetical protein M9Y10_014691 [Tritrichomonas musculus]|uniref:DUF3447 domain-containing protein n=1 Tax=Tritrichomonas musculus TaxID=1915356 RepID=A0ABR2L072_9EUKA
MEYLEKMKTIQNAILEYLDDEREQIFDELSSLLNDQKDIHELKSILYLISKICQNHHHGPFFFNKIKTILNILKMEVNQCFSNIEIFNIFKSNKRILLLLIDESILTVDSVISEKLKIYEDYFYPEIKKFNQTTSNDEQINELTENFVEKRRIGENDRYLCELIRNDIIEDFITNYTKNLFLLTDQISSSIFETNPFLIHKEPTLIEYSLFFGSIQILRFLLQNGVVLNSSSWLYAIHGHNPEIIHILESEKILPDDETYEECLKESIKCHHNDFAHYIKDNLLKKQVNHNNKEDGNNVLEYLYDEVFYGFQSYNFDFIAEDLLAEPIYFFYAVDFGYFKLVDYIKNKAKLDVNQLIIEKKFF